MSPYAVSKLTGEHYVRVFHTLYGLETLSLRYFNVFGPRQDPTPECSGVIAKFITCALGGVDYPVHGDGLQACDFSYIENVVNANLLAIKAEHLPGEPVNIACGSRVTLLELVDALNRIKQADLKPIFGPSRADDVRESQAAIAEAKDSIGYVPSVGLMEGLKRILDWYEQDEAVAFRKMKVLFSAQVAREARGVDGSTGRSYLQV